MPENIPQSAGWKYYDLRSEYQRMQVPNDEWCLTELNKDYEVVHIFYIILSFVSFFAVYDILNLCL